MDFHIKEKEGLEDSSDLSSTEEAYKSEVEQKMLEERKKENEILKRESYKQQLCKLS
jgi:hypothetical protein